MKRQEVGDIGNYYGGLFVAENEGKYYWIIENWNTVFEIDEWDEIPKALYDELLKEKL